MSIKKKKDHHFIVHFRIFADDVMRFNIIIIRVTPGTADCLAQKETGRPGGLRIQTKGKYKGIVSWYSSRQRHRKCEEELPLILFHLHSPSCSSCWSTLLLIVLLMFLTLPSSPLTLLMSFNKKKPFQKLSNPHNYRVDLVIVRIFFLEVLQ